MDIAAKIKALNSWQDAHAIELCIARHQILFYLNFDEPVESDMEHEIWSKGHDLYNAANDAVRRFYHDHQWAIDEEHICYEDLLEQLIYPNKNAAGEYRCTRDIETRSPGCPGYAKTQYRQGHYFRALTRREAFAKMARDYPEDVARGYWFTAVPLARTT